MKNKNLLKIILICVILIEITAMTVMVNNALIISSTSNQITSVGITQNSLLNTTEQIITNVNKAEILSEKNTVFHEPFDEQKTENKYLYEFEKFAERFKMIFPQINTWKKVDTSDNSIIYTDNGYVKNYNNVLMYTDGTFLLSMDNKQLKVESYTGMPAADIYITVTDKKSRDIMTALSYALIFIEDNPNVLKIEDIIELYENDSEYNSNGDKYFSTVVKDIEYSINRSNADGTVHVTILYNPH